MQETPSLRERNRREAWATIHTAAAELALEHGLAATTVEMIAARAGVSRRTFFNYFATKEDAILGVQELDIPEHALASFRAHRASLLERTVTLMAAVTRSATPDMETQKRRAMLVEAIPELHTRMRRFVLSAEELLDPILGEELGDSAKAEGGVQALLMLASTILRYAYMRDPVSVTGGNESAIAAAIRTFRDAAGASA